MQGEGKEAAYVGETNGSSYTRGKQHRDAMRTGDEKNGPWKHCMMEHGGKEVRMSMKVLAAHKTPLERQVSEAIEIAHIKVDCLMNSKVDYNGEKIPRVIVEVGNVQEDEWKGCDRQKPQRTKAGKREKEGNQGELESSGKKKFKMEDTPMEAQNQSDSWSQSWGMNCLIRDRGKKGEMG